MANEKVKCNACGNTYSVRGITRHIKACKAIQIEYSEGYQKYYTLKIKDSYMTDFFLYINVVSHLTLGELDQFLRDIWVECCNHLSGFRCRGYYYQMDEHGSYGIPGKNIELNQLVEVGTNLMYEYDYGSTTELAIEVIDELTGPRRESLIEIFARNKMPDYFLNNEDYPEPCNSPRIGVCGYDGPYDQFKDITSWGKNTKKIKPKNKDKSMAQLIEVTNEFIKHKPFKKFPSDLVIAIEDPETSIVYYCNILGQGKEDYGLNIHIGNYGLAGFIELMQDPNKPDLFQNLHFLSLMIDDLEFLEASDRTVLEIYEPSKLYGMYPLFRKALRGEAYKMLENHEVEIMTMVLEGIMEVYHGYKNKVKELLAHKNLGEMLKGKNGPGKFETVYVKAMPVFENIASNEIALKRLKKKSKKTADHWEVTSIFLPTVTENDCFPELIVIQDKKTGQILNQVLLEGNKDPRSEAKDLIEKTIKKSKIIPMALTTDKKYYFDSLKEYLSKLGTKIYLEPMGDYMVDFANGIYQGQDQQIGEEILEHLPEELIEKLMEAELQGKELDEATMLEIMKYLDIDLFE